MNELERQNHMSKGKSAQEWIDIAIDEVCIILGIESQYLPPEVTTTLEEKFGILWMLGADPSQENTECIPF